MDNKKSLIMNRILFVGLCLIGIMVFVFNESNTKQKEQPKKEVAKQSYKGQF